MEIQITSLIIITKRSILDVAAASLDLSMVTPSYYWLSGYLVLTLSWRRPLSYRNQSIDSLFKSLDWFLS